MTHSESTHGGVSIVHRPVLVVVTPIAPAPTGNGLAMRCHAVVAAAAIDHDVVLVVVPVAGRVPASSSQSTSAAAIGGVVGRHELEPDRPGDRTPLMAWMADPLWRSRLEALSPLPDAAAAVPPTRAGEVVALVDGRRVVGVIACRLTTALLGLSVAERLGVPLVVDADDDDVAFHQRADDRLGAEQWARVAALCLPRAALVLVASPADRGPMTDRWGLGERVVVVPNSVRRPAVGPAAPPGDHRLLFVANFTYPPNEAGAVWFVDAVLPLLPAPWHLDLVGSPSAAVTGLASGRVHVAGWVDDVAPWYDGADVVVAPLRSGSGTRIKLLEAFAHRRPVVSTTVGGAGLAVVDGVHLRVADEPDAIAAAIEEVARPAEAGPMVDAAERLVAEVYDAAGVGRRMAARLVGVTLGTR